MDNKIELIQAGNFVTELFGNSADNTTISRKVNEIIEAVNTLREDLDKVIENNKKD